MIAYTVGLAGCMLASNARADVMASFSAGVPSSTYSAKATTGSADEFKLSGLQLGLGLRYQIDKTPIAVGLEGVSVRKNGTLNSTNFTATGSRVSAKLSLQLAVKRLAAFVDAGLLLYGREVLTAKAESAIENQPATAITYRGVVNGTTVGAGLGLVMTKSVMVYVHGAIENDQFKSDTTTATGFGSATNSAGGEEFTISTAVVSAGVWTKI